MIMTILLRDEGTESIKNEIELFNWILCTMFVNTPLYPETEKRSAKNSNGVNSISRRLKPIFLDPSKIDREEKRSREEKLVADIIDRVRRECEAQGSGGPARRGYSRRTTVMHT